ncbi:hypothetical protein POVWA2_023310 [Plasmodium ovale wallikeri]|uniref:Uncharacterized protein n=1 Tax=Plasmodium ovale wallikeri TaxID=864142 RepID=A0A1A8YU94_PLAOA|nr:hypothetical protein POVWA1_023510 [Plasmodium ovale wallikeri]SBT35114.1 hypothetical protein POVWA2_023310 [Plasmodium ovale wallikeri]
MARGLIPSTHGNASMRFVTQCKWESDALRIVRRIRPDRARWHLGVESKPVHEEEVSIVHRVLPIEVPL